MCLRIGYSEEMVVRIAMLLPNSVNNIHIGRPAMATGALFDIKVGDIGLLLLLFLIYYFNDKNRLKCSPLIFLQ